MDKGNEKQKLNHKKKRIEGCKEMFLFNKEINLHLFNEHLDYKIYIITKVVGDGLYYTKKIYWKDNKKYIQ